MKLAQSRTLPITRCGNPWLSVHWLGVTKENSTPTVSLEECFNHKTEEKAQQDECLQCVPVSPAGRRAHPGRWTTQASLVWGKNSVPFAQRADLLMEWMEAAWRILKQNEEVLYVPGIRKISSPKQGESECRSALPSTRGNIPVSGHWLSNPRDQWDRDKVHCGGFPTLLLEAANFITLYRNHRKWIQLYFSHLAFKRIK